MESKRIKMREEERSGDRESEIDQEKIEDNKIVKPVANYRKDKWTVTQLKEKKKKNIEE